MNAERPLVTAALIALGLATAASTQPPPAPSTLFSSYDVINLKITAPFNDLFDHGRVVDEKYTVSGALAYGPAGSETTIDGITIGLRGHTSLYETECSFPKLKIQFPAGAAVNGSPFAGQRSLKIGTHCGDSTDDSVTAKYGRLPNEQAPHREAFVYRLLEALDIPSLKARPARIAYVYTDPRPGQTTHEPGAVVRNAMLLENSDEVVKRVGGDREIPETSFTNAREQFTVADTAALTFAESIIGNFDWCLKMTPKDTYRCNVRHPLWNIIAVAGGTDGRARPVPYDFDVSGMVAGKHRWFGDVYNEAFVESGSHAAVEVLGQLQRARTLFTRAELDAARARFNGKKAAAYGALDATTVDAPGKQNIREYLDAFFGAIESDDAFYRPAVVRATTAYTDASRGGAMCGASSAVPAGTVVSDPRQTNGRMIQVVLLDTLWHWAPPAKCPAAHTSAVWIESAAVSRDFPAASATH